MNIRIPAIAAIIRKDLKGLLPLVAVACAAYLAVPLIANLNLTSIGGDGGFWVMLQSNIYWLGFVLGMLLMISVFQQDPANSLNHDWLTRPIARHEWIIAKLLFLCLVVLLPVLLARFLVDLAAGMSPGLALRFSAGIQEFESVMLVPLMFMAALLAPNLRKLILLMVGVFFLFLLPGWSVTRPLLMMAGIDLGEDYGRLMWVQVAFMILTGLVGAGCIYWFQYCRRQMRAAQVSFWVAVLVMFLAIYPPQSLYSWDRAMAVHRGIYNSHNDALDNQVLLEPVTACFPAARIGGDASEQEAALLAQAAWPPEVLAAESADALTMATPVRYREILTEWITPAEGQREHSIEWRLDRIHTRARYSADSLAQDVPLQRSYTWQGRFDPISATEPAHWLVPGHLVEQLAADPSTRLTLEYDLALLSPRAFELPVDGVRRNFPELGSCSAVRDGANSKITVECLKRGVQPELISAQYFGMDASRVDSNSYSTLTHDWLEFFKRQRYELILEASGLTDTSSIIVTAYHAERILNRQLVIPGVLGDDPDICPLPGATEHHVKPASSWSDKSPHEVSSVAVDRGVRLEILDWRQEIKPEAPTLVLLPGLGATAHAYDDIAPKLAEKYNVIGMTRRGTGDSSQPSQGYDIARLSADVLQVMDTYGLESVYLVGHSFGGEELSYLGANHPERVQGLIYLDAAYDRVTVNSGESFRRMRELDLMLPPAPPVRPDEVVSYQAMEAYTRRTGRGPRLPEGEMIASYDLATGAIKHDELYLDALMAGIIAPDYRRITVPALSMYAVAASPEAMMAPWYDRRDPALKATVAELFELNRTHKLAEMQRFDSEVADSQVIAIENANHWIFVSHEVEVVRAIEAFVE